MNTAAVGAVFAASVLMFWLFVEIGFLKGTQGPNRDETDWVRIEIEAALAKKIPVIPVLIDGTALPPPFELPEGLRDLAFRQAAPVDSGRDFHPHIDRLIKAMDQLLALPGREASCCLASARS